MNLAQQILLLLLRGYRAIVSPLLTAMGGPLGLGCRFTPTCSVYASEAIRTHGAIRGFFLAARRLGRCHPWGGCGCDLCRPNCVWSPAVNLLLKWIGSLSLS
jgi:putative membrane protein insertion efficiency factor